jgi:hypothetical protein
MDDALESTCKRLTVAMQRVFLPSERQLLVTANVLPNSPILVTLMTEAIRSSEMSILTRAIAVETSNLTKHKPAGLCSGEVMSPARYELGFSIPEDCIFHSHRRENLKSYIALTG